ncbi:MAG: hypothetical protein WCG31_09430, partial [Deltaproteobacteria bacterium]
MQDKDVKRSADYVVGQEKRLAEIITQMDILPLVKPVLQAGADSVRITDERENTIWSSGAGAVEDSIEISMPLYLEGEVVGLLHVTAPFTQESRLRRLAELLLESLRIILVNNLKMMLTSEVHTTVISQSYDELLEINRRLSVSER